MVKNPTIPAFQTLNTSIFHSDRESNKKNKIRRHVSISQFQTGSSLLNDILKFNRLHNLIFCESGQTCDLLTFAIKSSLQYFAVLLSRSPTTLLCLDLIFFRKCLWEKIDGGGKVHLLLCHNYDVSTWPKLPAPDHLLNCTNTAWMYKGSNASDLTNLERKKWVLQLLLGIILLDQDKH